MDEIEIEELKAQMFYERRRRALLMANPDCRDPDHIGCEKCEECEDE